MKEKKGFMHRLQGLTAKTEKSKRSHKGDVTIVMAGILVGRAFAGVKPIVKSADLAIGVLRKSLADKNKTVESARKAGFHLIWGEDGPCSRGCEIRNIKGVNVGVLTFDAEEEKAGELKGRIAEARKTGAEFVIVYMSCSEKSEASVAKKIANAGADYIFGYGKKKNGPYTVILTPKGRSVPALYSCGSLARNQGETVLLELHLSKRGKKGAVISGEGYHPCMVGSKVIPLGMGLSDDDMETRIGMEEALFSIQTAMGVQGRLQCHADIKADASLLTEDNLTENQKRYEVKPVLTIRKKQKDVADRGNGYYFDQEKDCYCREKDSAYGEAAIVCTGHIEYDGQLEQDGEALGVYEFMKSFRSVAKAFDGADFITGGLATMASVEYPSVGEVSLKTRKAGYQNCRKEFVSALQRAGFTALMAANEYNACMGIEGIFDTERNLKAHNMIPCGIGHEKSPVVEINGIRIGFVSATARCVHSKTVLTAEAESRFLNVFEKRGFRKEIAAVKQKGAAFIIAYLHCGLEKRLLDLEERKRIAQDMAEAGADYIICTGSREVSLYYSYETADGRQVPIATSLGCFLSGHKKDDTGEGAFLKINLYRDLHHRLHVEDKYVPVQIHHQEGGLLHEVVPVKKSETVATALGGEIGLHSRRIIAVDDTYTRTLTIKEIYEILGKTPGEEDLARLGNKYDQPVSCVSIRRRYLRENGVAVMYKFADFGGTDPIKWDIQRCVDAGISLVIANEYYEELPCIVVEEPLLEVFEKLSKTVRDWYDPLTVAVTGSMGKTTAKELITKVFETNFKTLCASENDNAIYQIGNLLQAFEEDDEAYVQEVHGGTLGTAACVSRVISPDICIVTNIVPNHITQIGSMENLVANKLAIVEGMKPDGVLILCDDNAYLQDARPAVRTIRYSMKHTDADYYAQNIVDEGDAVRFEIVSRDSEFDKAGVYPAVLYTRGVHNVSNALAAFAAGRQAGIPPYKIIAGISRYRTTGIRQNVFVHNGIRMVLDTYNSNPKALLAMFDVLDRVEPEDGGRKILVLGMMEEQGDDSPQIHYDTGTAICSHPFDLLLCYGKDAKHMAAAVKACGREAYYFENRDILNRVIADTVRPGDVVMVKGSHSMELDKATLVPVFGETICQY